MPEPAEEEAVAEAPQEADSPDSIGENSNAETPKEDFRFEIDASVPEDSRPVDGETQLSLF